jgi:predicted RNA-binding Zn-ribbon protein involved in translation (DUF1610 family)
MSDGTPNVCKECGESLRYLNKNGEVADLREKVSEFGCPNCNE